MSFKLVKFDGKNFSVWKQNVEVWNVMNTANDDETKNKRNAKILESLGNYGQLPSVKWVDAGAQSSVADIIKAVQDKYGFVSDINANLAELKRLHLIKTMTVNEYTTEVIRLCYLINATMGEEEKKSYFISGLPVKFQQTAQAYAVMANDVIKLSAMISPTIESDRVDFKRGNNSKYPQKNQSNGQPKRKFNGTCNFCGAKGHKKLDCFKNPESQKFKDTKDSNPSASSKK
jgi:hypothetical protein